MKLLVSSTAARGNEEAALGMATVAAAAAVAAVAALAVLRVFKQCMLCTCLKHL
jgi:hypothetical protein